MHFVGMSAMSVFDPFGREVHITYRLDLTLVSLAVVIIVCYLGVWISSRDGVYVSDNEDHIENFIKDAANMSIQELRAMRHKNYVLFITLFKNMKGIVLGGVITATGVCVMHYIGMEAMVVENGKMEWDAGIVAASVLIALVAATAAFWILFRLLALYPYMEVLRIASAIVAAVAVNGMHYTGNDQ
jgi:NO-binding membrane sensor protein with MHYT domain